MAKALAWCKEKYPDEVHTVEEIRPAFLKKLLDYATVCGEGIDRETGEALDWIEVTQGAPFVTITTTKEGVARMEALARGYTQMLEQAS